MTIEELKNVIKILKLQFPSLTEPTSDLEWTAIGSMFANLSFGIATKVVTDVIDNDIFENLKKAPYITLKKMIVDKTEFDRQEKEQYKNGYEVYYAIDIYKGMMKAYNKRNGQEVVEKTRKMTAVEEDYYLYNLMTYNEFLYFSKQNAKVPEDIFYEPQTRTNNRITDTNFYAENKKWGEYVEERRQRAC